MLWWSWPSSVSLCSFLTMDLRIFFHHSLHKVHIRLLSPPWNFLNQFWAVHFVNAPSQEELQILQVSLCLVCTLTKGTYDWHFKDDNLSVACFVLLMVYKHASFWNSSSPLLLFVYHTRNSHLLSPFFPYSTLFSYFWICERIFWGIW